MREWGGGWRVERGGLREAGNGVRRDRVDRGIGLGKNGCGAIRGEGC